jgi:DNA-binding MarR family transcriptional regulator/GNAT superfamily N-acetyltransferase
VTPGDEQVAVVRDFNRFYTRLVGALDEGVVRSPYSLTDARVIYELAQRPATEVPDLRRSLSIDPGYLSRILARFDADGLIVRGQSATDARRQVVELTDAGRGVYETLDSRSQADVATVLARLSTEDRHRLVAAMRVIRQVLEPAAAVPRAYVLRPLRAGDVGWIVQRHGISDADLTAEAQAARAVADHLARNDPRRETAWIAELDGERVGCVLCDRRDDDVAELKLLYVEPRARGLGIGTRLIDECVRFARRAAYREITARCRDGQRVFDRAGFALRDETPQREQIWSRPLES